MKWFILTMVAFFSFCETLSFAECHGKADIGAILLRIDMINSGHKDKSLDMAGVRGDATILFYKGFCAKPVFIFAKDKHKGRLCSGSLALGHYFPINKELCLLPNFGVSASLIKSIRIFEMPGMDFEVRREISGN